MSFFNYKTLALFAMVAVYAGFWLLVYLRGRNRALSNVFNLFTIFMCFWTAALAMFYATNDNKISLILIKMVYMFGGLIPPSFVLYSYAYGKGMNWKEDVKPVFLYAPYVLLAMLYFLTDTMITEVVYIRDAKGWLFGDYHYVWEILFASFFVFGFYRYLQFYKNSTGIFRIQSKYILLGTLSGAILASITNVILPFFGIFDYVWLGPIGASVWLICIVYTIIKFQLLEISVVVTRISIFVFVYTIVLGIPFGLIFFGKGSLEKILGSNWYFVPLLMTLALSTVGPFIYSFIQNKAEEKILENEKRIQDLLSKVSFGMTTIKELNRLLALIVDIIRKTLGINHVDVYLKDNNQYLLKASNNGHLPSLSFAQDNSLIGHLQRDYNVLVYEELQQASVPGKDDVLKKLDSLSAKIVVPFTLQNHLLGFLVLGQRNNKEVYSQYIVNALRVMGDQIALAIENCQFLAAEKEMLKKEGARARRESLDMLVSTMAHEIDNPITSVIGHADIISEYIENNKERIPQEDYSEILKSAQYVMKDAARVSKIIKAVEDYSKGGEGKLKEVSFYDVLDPFHTLLTLVKKKISGVHYTEEIEPAFPPVMAEQILIEEILLNFSENAFHAVRENAGAKNVTLKIFNKNNFLRIEMIDNGYGIPQNILKQLFEVPTTTKGSSEGTGIGLYRIRQICNILKAKYGAESKGPGQGALLYVEIPFVAKGEKNG